MPVPGSQIVGFRPLPAREEQLVRQGRERARLDDRWSPTASLLLVAAASTTLWVAIGLAIHAIL